MILKAWHLPWTLDNVPHALLDILRGCNIHCRACYNTEAPRLKSLSEIESEIDSLLRLRKLQSVSIVGGEVTLHPDLCRIVEILKSKGLFVEIITNGMLLAEDILRRLQQAGTDLIFLHIDSSQERPDLPPRPAWVDVAKLLEEKAKLITSCGIEVGMTVIAYDDNVSEVVDAVDLLVHNPDLTYLIVTLYRDVTSIDYVQGNLYSGMTGKLKNGCNVNEQGGLTNFKMYELLKERFAMRPFARVGSNVSKDDPRWLSYLIGTISGRRGSKMITEYVSLKASMLEAAYLFFHQRLLGHYPFFTPQNSRLFRLELLLNGVLGGSFVENLKFFVKTLRPGSNLKAKRILFQNPAMVDENGKVVYCRNCPDAVLKEGKLVPVCISDRVVAA